ncbi:hypothetical protein ACMBCM_09675 [Spiroplasma sp. K1]
MSLVQTFDGSSIVKKHNAPYIYIYIYIYIYFFLYHLEDVYYHLMSWS